MLAVVVIAGAIVVRGFDPSLWQVFDRRFRFLAATVLAMLAGDAIALAMAPIEIVHQVSTTAGRLISQAMPLILLAVVQPWRVLLAATPAAKANVDSSSEHPARPMSNRFTAPSGPSPSEPSRHSALSSHK
jgi:hypothetical protein